MEQTQPVITPPGSTDSLHALRNFRAGFHRCWTGWADAGFELCEAMLSFPGSVSSMPMLSTEPCFRRSHGSLYKALHHGHIDATAMKDLLAAHAKEQAAPEAALKQAKKAATESLDGLDDERDVVSATAGALTDPAKQPWIITEEGEILSPNWIRTYLN